MRGWKEAEDGNLRTEIAMRAITVVMKKALDYAALKAAATVDLLIVIVLILKE